MYKVNQVFFNNYIIENILLEKINNLTEDWTCELSKEHKCIQMKNGNLLLRCMNRDLLLKPFKIQRGLLYTSVGREWNPFPIISKCYKLHPTNLDSLLLSSCLPFFILNVIRLSEAEAGHVSIHLLLHCVLLNDGVWSSCCHSLTGVL